MPQHLDDPGEGCRSKSKTAAGWLLGRHAELTAHPTHAYIFVVLNRDKPPEFYVVPSETVAKNQRGAASMPEFRREEAEPYRDGWPLLKGAAPQR